MAFGFLKSAGDIVQGAAGIASLFGSKKEPEASKASSAALKEAIAMAKASANPNSPQFKNLVALEEANLREGAVRQITEYLRQNQRNVARGGISGIVNPERRDEAVMQSLARAFQGAQQTARNSARQTLMGAAGTLTGAGSGLQPVANIQNTIADQNINRRASLGQAIGEGLGSVGGILDQWTQKPPVPAPGSTRVQLA